MRTTLPLLGLCLAVSLAFFSAAGSELPSRPPQGWQEQYRRPQVVPYPDDNPWSASKVQLGATLFFDPVLSDSHTTACVSCHEPNLAWSDTSPKAIGDGKEVMPLRSPTLLNLAWLSRLGWDGKFADVESVSFRAISGKANMALSVQEALDRLSANPAYVRRFHAAFGPGSITQGRVEQALATYQRGIVSAQAPFDRWVAGDEAAVGDAAKRGFALFDGKARCAGCHQGWAFTDGSFHDIGTAIGDDIGRGALFPSSVVLRHAFKTPTLRDVAVRPPYMHNGSLATLEAVVDLYDRGGIARPSRSPKMQALDLTHGEKADLISFLQTLTSDAEPVARPLPPR